MLWPGSGTNTTGASAGRKNAHGRYIGGNGEIDFPEADLDGIDTISAFVHWQNGTSGDSRTIMPSSVSAAGSGWHVTTIEWLAGVSFTSWLDGNLVGTLTGAQVPAEPMHLVLQTETILDTSKKLQSVTGNVYVDWITIETV